MRTARPSAVANAFSNSCQTGIRRRQGLRGDAGADDDRSQERAAEELAGEGASGVRTHDAMSSCETRSSAPGTSLKYAHVPRLLRVRKPAVVSTFR